MGNYFKRIITFLLAVVMTLMIPLESFASGFNYNNPSEKYDYINSINVDKAAKFYEDQTEDNANERIKESDPPALYTLIADFKIHRSEDETKINDQPYIATVGEKATEEEQKKVDKDVYLRKMDGYTTPTPKFHLNYKYIKDRANKPENLVKNIQDPIFKNLYKDNHPYIYKSVQRPVLIKHVFQKLYDKSKYGGLTEDSAPIEKKQYGITGQDINISPLSIEERIGFVPEGTLITTKVPESLDKFYVEYRYNRDKYNVVYETDGGTEIPARTLYYGQTIPKVSVPKKIGSEFLGWKSNYDFEYKGEDGKTYKIKAGELIKDEHPDKKEKKFEFKDAKPADKLFIAKERESTKNKKTEDKGPVTDLVFKAVWKEVEKADYTILYYAEKPDHKYDKIVPKNITEKYDYVGARVIQNQPTGTIPDLKNINPEGITFPDLGTDGKDIVNDKEKMSKYYTFNENLTNEKNSVEEKQEDGSIKKVQKKVDSTGNTVYEVFYDRTVYTIIFEKSTSSAGTFDPEITVVDRNNGKKEVYDYTVKGGKAYTITARFGESLRDKWVRDGDMGEDYVNNIFKGDKFAYISKGYEKDTYSQGWKINLANKTAYVYRDMPPYRLTKDEFIDINEGARATESPSRKDENNRPISYKGENIISLGIAQSSINRFIPHHEDFELEDLKGEFHYEPSLYYWKSDTNSPKYAFTAPILKGFKAQTEKQKAERLTESKLLAKNDNRKKEEKTPFAFQKELNRKKFTDNFYISWKYSRNSYKLNLNSDPKTIKEDSAYENKKFANGDSQQQDVKYENPLADIKLPILTDEDKPNYIKEEEKNDGIKYVFKGWALDRAGKNMVQNAVYDENNKPVKLEKNENSVATMPDYNYTLNAIWGEEEPTWTIKIDPNGGTLPKLGKSNFELTHKDDNDKIEDIFKENKDESRGAIQAFKIKSRTRIDSILTEPTKQGYDFLGWELVRYNEDGTVDNSYYESYKVPELYSFGNEVVSNIYLKAIWVNNRLTDVISYHRFFDSNGKELTDKLKKQVLKNRRIGTYTAAVAKEQNENWTLMTEEELRDVESYKKYKDTAKEGDSKDNEFFQVMKVDDPKKEDPAEKGKIIDNPDAHNEFNFYYRAFRTRQYKVNYLDERIKNIKEPTKKDIEKYTIIPQELVENGNKDFDARNFRAIPGWKLTSEPQQQLFFDINSEGKFEGINGTGKDEINFYYKDVRVIERKSKDSPTPKGYVRVIFQTEDKNPGGNFGKNADGTPRHEVIYDVIEGLMSDNILVPQELKAGENPDPNKIYIIPDPGRKFIKWDKQRLLNENTVLKAGTPYVFTAYFDWSGLKINELVRTEAYKKDAEWVNNFAPTHEELKKALSWVKDGKEGPLPSGANVKIIDTDDAIYEKVKEANEKDSDELVRNIKISAEVDFGNGSIQKIEIPVKIYKNVYEALTSEEKPKFLADAEKNELKNITGNYVKVTVNPTGKPNKKDSKIYYVNKNANVEIPEIIFLEKNKLGFTQWAADVSELNENGSFDFSKRHKFTQDTVISPGFAIDVIPQTGEEKPQTVPNYYVEVKFNPTNKVQGNKEKIYWVNPNNEVTIDISDPLGNEDYTFKEWKIDENSYNPKKLHKFTQNTEVKADYLDLADVIEYNPKDPKTKPEGYVRVTFAAEDGVKLTDVKAYFVKKNKNINLFGNPNIKFPSVTVNNGYKDTGWDKEQSTVITDQDIEVKATAKKLEDKIEVKNGVERPKGYVKVTFKTEDANKGKVVEKLYYVNKEKYVNLEPPTEGDIKEEVGYKFGTWDRNISNYLIFDKDTDILATFNKEKDVVPKTKNDESEKPKGYKKVTFKINGAGGSIKSGEISVYYVNPNSDVTIKAPATIANIGYEFNEWSIQTTQARKYSQDTEVGGTFKALGDIIPAKDSTGKDNKQPESYVKVTFLPGQNGKIKSGETVYYVNPNANKTLKDIAKPIVEEKIGYKINEKNPWSIEDTKIIKADLNVIAKYEELPDIVDKKDNYTKDYVQVTFDTTEKGHIKDSTETRKIVFVNPERAVVLKGKEPTVISNPTFKFNNLWDLDLTVPSQFTGEKVIKALYNSDEDIFEQEKPGYAKVIFKTDTNKGTLTGTQTYWIKPNKNINVPAPAVTNKTGYTFSGWDRSLIVNAPNASSEITINANYEQLSDIISGNERRPEGYVKITFKPDANGYLDGQNTYFVNSSKAVNLEDIAKKLRKIPITGFTEINGNWSPANLNQEFKKDIEFTFNFKPLQPIIEEKSGISKPDGYVEIIFKAGNNGSLDKGDKHYYVNPRAGVKLGEVANDTTIRIPKPQPNTNYKEDQWYPSLEMNVETSKSYTAFFKPKKVTLTYIADDATEGKVPNKVTVDVGTRVDLANARDLKKDNFNFKSWKINGIDYGFGDRIELDKDMVAIAQWSNQRANVDYKFVPANQDVVLPQEVLGITPTPEEKNVGEVVTPSQKNFAPVVIDAGPNQGTWSFRGWDKESLKVKNEEADNLFTGTWDFTSQGQVNVNYEYTYGGLNPSENVREKIEATKPSHDSVFKGNTVTAPANIQDTFVDTVDGRQGTWSFANWTPDTNQEKVQNDVTFTGAWIFTEDGYLTVNYKFAFVGEQPSPGAFEEINRRLPANKSVYPNAYVEAPENIRDSFRDIINGQKGQWVFITWKPNIGQIVNRNGTEFEGVWRFIKEDDPIVHTEVVEKIVEKEVYLTNEVRREVRYMRGFQDKFRPKDPLTRAEAAQILANALVEDRYKFNKDYKLSYKDIKDNDWFAKAVKITSQAGVFKGYDDGEFKPQKKITRAEWISTLKRFQMLLNAEGNQMNLKENHWAMAEIEAAFKEGWLEIYTNKIVEFKPDEPITREEVAAVSNKAFGRLIDKNYIKANEKNLINYKDIDPSMWSYIDILNASNTFLHKENNYEAYKINENSYNIETSKYNISQDAFQRTLR